MTTVQYSGALPPKKKSELVEIAEKMSLEATGTKEDISNRIKAYLDAHDLSENPMFSGLYVTKKKPGRKETAPTALVPTNPTSDEESPMKRKGSSRRKQTPPPVVTEDETTGVLTAPPSPVRALIANVETTVSNALPAKQSMVQVVEKASYDIQTRAKKAYASSREFLSSATNIAGLSVLFEFLFVMTVITPWQYYQLPVTKIGTSGSFYVPYPPLAFLLSTHLYKTLAYWALPTVLAPQLAGSLISFTTPPKDVDPLSAAIVKLALVVALDDSWFILQGRPIAQWRIVGAATNLAFAIAEAVEERRVITREPVSHM